MILLFNVHEYIRTKRAVDKQTLAVKAALESYNDAAEEEQRRLTLFLQAEYELIKALDEQAAVDLGAEPLMMKKGA